ncbi:MAG: class I SAM-dependent methyltransferase [Pirellulales bacterium]
MISSSPASLPPLNFAELSAEEVHRYNAAADAYYRTFANARFETNKPFANAREAAFISYQIGLLLAAARIGTAQRILEFGAGAGWLSSLLHRLGNEMFLLEVSPAALDMARETFRRDGRHDLHAVGPHFDTYDGFAFPYPDDHFDRLVCFDALHHVPNPQHVLREMHRVLKPGGLAGFVESGAAHADLPAIRDCVARTGILERNTVLSEVSALAHAAGFSRMTVKPFPAVESWEVEYDALAAAGAPESAAGAGPPPTATPPADQSIFALHKGQFCYDGTCPHQPRAAITIDPTEIRATPGARVVVRACLTNTGDTLFNAAARPLGGFVAVGAHLFADDRLLDFDFLHHALPHDVGCGECCRFEVAFTAPLQSGRYQLEWDVVIEGAMWAGQAGSPTAHTSLIVCP